MKLSGALIGLVASQGLVQEDCPNDRWRVNELSDKCEPVDVKITCQSTDMIIEFEDKHVYKELLSDNIGKFYPRLDDDQDCDPEKWTIETTNEEGSAYKLTVPLDECGTKVRQENGEIVFENKITGSDEAIKMWIGDVPIFTTQKLSFSVECYYTDEVNVKVDDVHIDSEMAELEGARDEGLFKYIITPENENGEITAENQARIGEQITFRVNPEEAMTTKVYPWIKSCTISDPDDPEMKFDVIQNYGCYSRHLETDFAKDFLTIPQEKEVSFNMNAFAFQAKSGMVDVSCDIKLCVDQETCLEGSLDLEHPCVHDENMYTLPKTLETMVKPYVPVEEGVEQISVGNWCLWAC